MNMIEVLNLISVSVLLFCFVWYMSKLRVYSLECIRKFYGKNTLMNFVPLAMLTFDFGAFGVASYILEIDSLVRESFQYKFYTATLTLIIMFSIFLFLTMYEDKLENKLDEWADRHHLRIRKY